VNKSLDI